MRVAIYDRVEPSIPADLPLRLNQSCSQRAAALLLVLVVPAVAAMGYASLMLVHEALFAPAARAIVAQHPALGLEVVVAIGFWIYLLVLPIRRLSNRMTLTRTVEIDARSVTVTEGGYLRTWTWSAPLGSFAGVAHHLRATLSGTRHELILVHPERDKSVLLSLADSMSQREVERVAQLLGQKEIPSSELYRFRAPPIRHSKRTWRHTRPTSTVIART
jgi:hypothetical protein